MDPAEEQQQEIEVLQSIYPDELNIISSNQYDIRVRLDCPSDRVHTLVLQVEYTPEYPNTAPKLSIENITNETEENEIDSSDEDEEEDQELKKALSMSEFIEFDKNDLNTLLTKLNTEADLNLGMPSIFALVTLLKDEAELLFQQNLQLKVNQFEHERNEKEKKDQMKFIGTKVTVESFNEWRLKFRKSMEFEKKDLERFNKMHMGKMTGKEIFEKGLAKDDEDESEASVLDSLKKVNI